MTRLIFTIIGDLPACRYTLDDTMYATRAIMLGHFVIIQNAILLYYRWHGANISSQSCSSNASILNYIRSDAESRNYHLRGIPAHEPILSEIKNTQ